MGLFFEQLVRIPEIPRRDVQLDPRSRKNSIRAVDVALRCRSKTRGEKIYARKNHCRRVRRGSSRMGARREELRVANFDRVGDRTERELVRLERKMEWRRE